MTKTKTTGTVKVHFKKPYPHDVIFHRGKKGTGIAARKRFTKAKAEALLRAISKVPSRRPGGRGGMTKAMKDKARRTIKRRFKTL